MLLHIARLAVETREAIRANQGFQPISLNHGHTPVTFLNKTMPALHSHSENCFQYPPLLVWLQLHLEQFF